MASPAIIILSLVTVERAGELIWGEVNRRRLLAAGAREYGAGHYPLIVALHGAWLIGLWLLAPGRAVLRAFVALYVVCLFGRAWVMVNLGRYWTTRIVVLPGAPLVVTGPYRFFPHPVYLVVIGEIACLPLMFGMPVYALVFSVLNAAMLTIRIRAEDRALARSGPTAEA